MTNITRWPAKAWSDLAGRAGFSGVALLCCAAPVIAADLVLPIGAQQKHESLMVPDSYRLPIGAWADGLVPDTRLTGQVARQSWRIGGQDLTTLQLMQPIHTQLEALGYTVLFECSGRSCGGFDFRFGTEVLPAPAMYVDLTDFRFLSARDSDDQKFVSILVSKSAAAGFVQIIRVLPESAPAPAITAQAGTLVSSDLAQRLERSGSVILSDLAFETGSAALGNTRFDSLAQLSDYLLTNPGREVSLVGHTDAVGSLEANITLSRRRATSVMERLTEAYGVPARQVSAEGVGYLSPIASSLTDEGRLQNRRVEAVLTSVK